jgi:alanine racemase
MTSDMRSSFRWRRACVSIDERALAHNLGKVREYAPHTRVMAVIKADAYGHGMLRTAQVLDTADVFAVAMAGEACALRDSGCTKPVVVLHGSSSAEELETFSELGLSSVIHQQSQLSLLLESRLAQPIDTWLKIDTGMHRLGIDIDDVDTAFGQLRNSSNVNRVFVMSHFAKSDEVDDPLNNSQLDNFIKVTNDIDVDCSMANSAAIMRLPGAHFEVVRPGIMLYGSSPFDDVTAEQLGLKAVMQFESSLLDIKRIKAGETIGYGGSYRCTDDMLVGIVAAGYGDGYPRHAGNKARVWINGRYCSLLGRVSMDSLCVDLSDVAADIGDRVVLWGKELSVDEVARDSGTIAYELLCHAGSISGNHPR